MKTCETCCFWFELSRESDADEPDGYFAIGECRRFPPIVSDMPSTFPHSYHDACCGEWEQAFEPVDPEVASPPMGAFSDANEPAVEAAAKAEADAQQKAAAYQIKARGDARVVALRENQQLVEVERRTGTLPAARHLS